MADNPKIAGYVVVSDWNPSVVYKGGQGASVVNYSLVTWQAIAPRRGIPPGTISGEWLRVPTKVQQTAPFVPPLPGPPPPPKVNIVGDPPVLVSATNLNGNYNAQISVGTYYPTVLKGSGQTIKGSRGLVPDPPTTAGTTLFLCEDGTWRAAGGGGGGTVTSVALAAPAEFLVTGSPVVAAGTLTFSWVSELQNLVLASPDGAPGTPSFRALVPGDIPALSYVSSVGLSTDASYLTVGSSPITSSGTITINKTTALTANRFVATPDGAPGTADLRAIVPTDLAGTPGAGKYWDGGGTGSWTTLPAPGTGTVTSVALALPASLYTISGSPVTTSGTLTGTLIVQTANQVWAGPTTGVPATPTFRALVAADIPSLAYVTSVGLSLPAEFTVTVSPITSSGTLTAIWANENANVGFFGPTTGGASTPAFRAIVPADLAGTPGAGKYWDGAGTGAWTTLPAPGTGTVTSVALTAPTEITVGGSPVTTSGTLALTWTNESANKVFAGPTSGGATTPNFRSLVALDLASGGTSSNFLRGDMAWAVPVGTGIGITTGKDRNRPAAAGTNIYMATDTYQTYVSDQTIWYNAASGWDKVTLDTVGGGMSDTSTLIGPASITAGPSFANGQSIVVGFNVISLPGTGGGIITSYGNGNITTGWIVGASTVNSNKIRALFKGVNSDANIEINLTLTTGFHVLAIANLGTSLRACLDGGTVVASAALSGTYTAPTASSIWYFGRYFGAAGFAMTWGRCGFVQAYGSSLSDGDLQTVSGTPSSFIPTAISADPTYDFQVRWMRNEGIASQISAWQIYGTSKNKTSYFSAAGAGLFKTFE